MGEEAECAALFDAGSGYAVVQRSFFEKNFGRNWTKLPRAIRLYSVNGRFIEVASTPR